MLGSLELVRDMSQLITKLVQDEAKDKKKLLKKEQQEKAKAELNKVNDFVHVLKRYWYLSTKGTIGLHTVIKNDPHF